MVIKINTVDKITSLTLLVQRSLNILILVIYQQFRLLLVYSQSNQRTMYQSSCKTIETYSTSLEIMLCFKIMLSIKVYYLMVKSH